VSFKVNLQLLIMLVAIFAALMVITARNPVKAALSLVLTFVASAVIWLLAEAEFLAISLILVYVGAVMVLFLFVVMMLDIEQATAKNKFARYLPLALVVACSLAGILCYTQLPLIIEGNIQQLPDNYNNVVLLGSTIYTDYLLQLELAGILLLVAIIAAISLSWSGSKVRKAQNPAQQVKVCAKDRVRLVEMPADDGQNKGA